jgi:hypothetical protein
MREKTRYFRKFKYLILVALVIFIGVLSWNFSSNFKIERKVETEVSAVLEKIKQLSQLDTVEMYFNEILDYRAALKINDFEIPFTTKSFIFVVKAKVQSGIDLVSLTEDDIEIVDNKITVSLDRAKITSKEILEYNAYAEKDGLFNKVTNEDTLKALNDFLVHLEQQAHDNGILEMAEKNAEQVLKNILSLIGFEEVIIKFKK